MNARLLGSITSFASIAIIVIVLVPDSWMKAVTGFELGALGKAVPYGLVICLMALTFVRESMLQNERKPGAELRRDQQH
jgi:hypothetical protein